MSTLLPYPLNLVGKKHVQLAKKWVPSAAFFGGSAAVALVYFTDWRVVADYIPFYNGKFSKEPPPE